MKQYKILNVKCAGCANTIIKKLAPLYGEVKINLEVIPRTLSIDKEDIDEIELRKLLKSIGYPMNDENLNFVEGITTKATSFVSCAVGKSTLEK